MLRKLLVVLLVVPAVWIAGCSSGSKPPDTIPTFPVTGVVHVDGQPAADVRVTLFPADKPVMNYSAAVGGSHQGRSGPDGKFQITTYFANDGAPVGEYIVICDWQRMIPGGQLADADEPAFDPAAIRVNKKYGDPYNPQLPKVKVEEGKSTDIGTLDLKTK